MVKNKVIEYLESLGFVTISDKSSSRQIFFKENIAVTVEER
jgi:predicted RNA binding protein YcfA (HicA-like mRNA interferase family)